MTGSLLEEHDLMANEDKIVDASFVETSRQRNTREVDAKWTKKENLSHYGYKDH